MTLSDMKELSTEQTEKNSLLAVETISDLTIHVFLLSPLTGSSLGFVSESVLFQPRLVVSVSVPCHARLRLAYGQWLPFAIQSLPSHGFLSSHWFLLFLP